MSENILYNTLLNKAMKQCSLRELCRADVYDRLLRWGLEHDDANKVINTLMKENYINESRYAYAFVRDKFRFNRWGRVKIAAALSRKKIPGEVIRSALGSIDDELYKRSLREILQRHRRVVKAGNNYELKAKLLRYGLSKGFEKNILYDILNNPEEWLTVG